MSLMDTPDEFDVLIPYTLKKGMSVSDIYEERCPLYSDNFSTIASSIDELIIDENAEQDIDQLFSYSKILPKLSRFTPKGYREEVLGDLLEFKDKKFTQLARKYSVNEWLLYKIVEVLTFFKFILTVVLVWINFAFLDHPNWVHTLSQLNNVFSFLITALSVLLKTCSWIVNWFYNSESKEEGK